MIVEPKVPLEVRTQVGFLTYRFLVDTGADVSVVPRYIAREVGLTYDRLPELTATGIGPGSVSVKVGSLPIRLGAVELTIRCLFLDHQLAPFILGCADVLDRFALTIDADQGKIIFNELP